MSARSGGPKRTLTIGLNAGGSGASMLAQLGDAQPATYWSPTSWKYTDVGVRASASQCAGFITEHFSPATWDILRVVIAMSGASNADSNEEFVRRFCASIPNKDVRARIESDSTFTLRAAYPTGESGYLVIAGTGSVAMARTRAGNVLRVGGWGRLLGDEGSGYWLGLEALKYYTRTIDAASAGGILFERIRNMIERRFDGDLAQLRSALYSAGVSPAEFVPVLFESLDDPEALSIVRSSANHLASKVKLLERRSGGDVSDVLTLHGSVGCDPVYANEIATAVGRPMQVRLLPNAEVLAFALQEAHAL